MEVMVRAGAPGASLVLGAVPRGLVALGCRSMLLVPLVATWSLFDAVLPRLGEAPRVVVARRLLMAAIMLGLMRAILCDGRCSGAEG